MDNREFGTLSHYWSGKIEDAIGKAWSRKYNGFSTIWDGGLTRGMLSSNVPWNFRGADSPDTVATGLWTLGRGNKPKVVHAPKAWLDKLPRGVPLHGELWKDDSLKFVKRKCRLKNPSNADWVQIKFKVFSVKPYELFQTSGNGINLPQGLIDEMEDSPFYSKSRSVENLIQDATLRYTTHCLSKGLTAPHEQVVEFIKPIKLNSRQQVLTMLEDFQKTDWEGLMLTDFTQPYECKRSYNVLKYKPSYEDTATVIGYVDGKTGKNVGKVGAIRVSFTIKNSCLTIHGGKEEHIGKEVVFSVSGINEEERDSIEESFPIGSEINFSFKMFSEDGIPQHSNVYRGL